ncbi:MAG TPA: adenylate/guanylate cyclase domain-containing protein [Gemmataceae bacterium]|jgi:adenylate cyclase|nr:adenylate/guanylate cyclase domain-containing protein [Gemmataceae bacterium]
MLRIQVSNKRERQEFEHPAGPLEFGRGGPRNGVPRCTVQDLYVSKDHVHVLELDGGRVRVENLSQRNSIRLADNSVIATGATRDLDTPAQLTVGETTIRIEAGDEGPADESLRTVASPMMVKATARPLHSLLELGQSPNPETLTQWFETVIAVQRAAAGSPEFYEQTARAVVALVGLDRGLVVLRRAGRWMVQARYPDEDVAGREFSTTILARVERERRTFFQSAATSPAATESLQGVEAVAASPIFDNRDQVVGAVYGLRTRFNPHTGLGIGPLEAQVMQLLASAVGVGLARVEQEAEAGRLRVQFEQFFSADLARELQKNPRLLEGQEREITVLFSDIRGFSRLAERLGPTDSCRLVSDVMERLTARVRDCDGVVVDYSGDGLMAMWNAPADQPDHAAKACRAALGMLADLPQLDAEWQGRLGGPLRLGLGLNTGPALCGNIGSRYKFKYGALGHAVNLASRVEGATKQLGVPLLITGSTREKVGDALAARRLCRAKVVGIAGAVDLYELHAEGAAPEWQAWRDGYEKGLALFEAGDWRGAYRTLHPLSLNQETPDLPCLILMGRAIDAMRSPPEYFDGIIELSSK